MVTFIAGAPRVKFALGYRRCRRGRGRSLRRELRCGRRSRRAPRRRRVRSTRVGWRGTRTRCRCCGTLGATPRRGRTGRGRRRRLCRTRQRRVRERGQKLVRVGHARRRRRRGAVLPDEQEQPGQRDKHRVLSVITDKKAGRDDARPPQARMPIREGGGVGRQAPLNPLGGHADVRAP